MKRQAKRMLVLTLSVLFLLLGIAGLVLPFLQGILFITIGVLLFSMLSPTVRDWLEHYTRKWPKFHAIVVKAEQFIVKVIGEV